MASNYDGLARMIVQNVGGKDNVAGLSLDSHCLVFELKDMGRANTAIMESFDGVSGVRKEDSRYIVEVSGPAEEIYAAVCEKGQIEGSGQSAKGSGGGTAFLRYLVGALVAFGVAWFLLPVLQPAVSMQVCLLVAVLAVIAASVIAWFIFDRKPRKAAPEPAREEIPAAPIRRKAMPHNIMAPVRGRILPLQEIPDDAFASGILGQGVGIVPSEGRIYAPCDGRISTFFPSGHAIGIATDGGAELLMHVGLGTVTMNGEGFSPKKQQGDTCRKGELLLEFDIDKIREKGLNPVTPVIVTNGDKFSEVIPTTQSEAGPQDVVIALK